MGVGGDGWWCGVKDVSRQAFVDYSENFCIRSEDIVRGKWGLLLRPVFSSITDTRDISTILSLLPFHRHLNVVKTTYLSNAIDIANILISSP